MSMTEFLFWKMVVLATIAFLLGAFGLLPEQRNRRPPEKRIK